MPVDLPDPSTEYGNVIGASTPCVKCSYDLKGLRMGGMCPECGTPITPKRSVSKVVDNLTYAPRSYLRLVAAGLAVLPVAVVALFGLIVVYAVDLISDRVMDFALVGLALFWLLGVGLVTCKRVKTPTTVSDRALDSGVFRTLIRLAMASPVVSFLLEAFMPGTVAAQSVFDFITIVGVVLLAIYLSSIADWAGDSSLGDRLRASAWLIVVFGALGIALSIVGGTTMGLAPLARVLGFWADIISLVGLVIFAIPIFQLGMLGLWALNNAKTGDERDRRIAERRAKEDAERTRRVEEITAKIPTAPAPVNDTPIASLDGDDPIPLIDKPDGDAVPSRGMRRDRPDALASDDTGLDEGVYELAPEDPEEKTR